MELQVPAASMFQEIFLKPGKNFHINMEVIPEISQILLKWVPVLIVLFMWKVESLTFFACSTVRASPHGAWYELWGS